MRDMQTPAVKIGRAIARLRRTSGKWVDQGVLAHKIGMSQANLSRIESGAVLVRIDTLCAITAVFGLAASDLLKGVDL